MRFTLPNLGEGITEGTVVNVLVAVGDALDGKRAVIELETNKAVMEIECPALGKVTALMVKAGDKLPVGAPILEWEAGAAEAAAAAKAPAPAPAPASAPAAPATSPAAPPAPKPAPLAAAAAPALAASGGGAAASPMVRRLARELGVDLGLVPGSGPGRRILESDVQLYVKQALSGGRPVAAAAAQAPAAAQGLPGLKLLPLPDFSRFGQVERKPVSGMRKATAEAMTRAWSLVPMVTQFDSADVTDLEAARKRMLSGKHAPKVRITVTVLAMKAVVAALKLMPQFNASFDHEGGELILKKYYNLGVAVDTEHGLVVPVIREVDKKSVQELAAELDMLAEKARARKLSLEDMSGGSFTISNLGGIGGTGFTPIVNWPEVAILGISRSRKDYVWREGAEGDPPSHEASAGQGEFRLTLPLSLSYDHRVIDGADGARFLRKVSELLSDPLQILMQA